MGRQHTVETLLSALQNKGVNWIQVVSITAPNVTVRDLVYGEYVVDLKSFCKSMAFPKHKRRQHVEQMEAAAEKHVGKTINGYLITELFYGPDRGYKNRSYYVVVRLACGHDSVTTVAHLKKHRKPDAECVTCNKTTHGARGTVNGVRIKRTSTYTHWQRIHKTLPLQFQSFSAFLDEAGTKPDLKSEIVIGDDGRLRWTSYEIAEDREINLIANAVRQAFRHSGIYKKAVEAAKIETEEGTRYRCAECGQFAKRSSIQVDHIDPIKPIDGSPLTKDQIIDRIWTDKIQILDRTCHSKKSTAENKERKQAKLRRNSK